MLRPDVIKLDLRLIQQHPTGEIASIMNAVHAEAERSGTLVLAEGLETEEHVQTARAFGATLGQGWFLGRPGPLPARLPAFEGRPVHIVPRGDQLPDRSPFELAASHRAPRAAVKPLLIEVSKQLEAQAQSAGESAVLLAAFQHAQFFTPATRKRYAALAESTAFVGALGEDMPPKPLPGVRGAVLRAGDPLLGEWDILAEAGRVAQRAAEEVLQALQEPFDLSGIEVRVAASVGVAVEDGPDVRPDDLLRWADRAMYEAKNSGGRRWAAA